MAFAQSGNMQIEQLSEAPSVYADLNPSSSAGGFHHLLTMTKQLDADVRVFAGKGDLPGCLGGHGSPKFASFDTRGRTGYYTEVMEQVEGMLELFWQDREAALGWDRSDPVRIVSH